MPSWHARRGAPIESMHEEQSMRRGRTAASDLSDEVEEDTGDSREKTGLLPVVQSAKPKKGLCGYESVGCSCLVMVLMLVAWWSTTSSGADKGATSHISSPGNLIDILATAGKRALGGGLGGAVAGICQVLALMWLRTAMNYQYRHGGSLGAVLRLLYAQGGVRRFYQGLQFALVQTPLSRFGDTAANSGVLALFTVSEVGATLPIGLRTACASGAGSLWRILITPFDTCKTTLQVEGVAAYTLLLHKARDNGWLTLWHGAIGNAAASFVGSYPWFLTFNALDEALPRVARNGPLALRLLRSASMGCMATGVSDVSSNSLRVVKTIRQTSAVQISYTEVVRQIIAAEGVRGLFCRGLGTRLLANALQSALFAVVWKLIESEVSAS